MFEPTSHHGDAPSPGNGRLELVEQRLHRLEDAVAALQETRQLEERLVERVVDRLVRNPPAALRDPANVVIEAPRSSWLPALGLLRSTPGTAPEALPAAVPTAKPSWLLTDTFGEGRAIVRMFFDPRFRVARSVEILSLGLIVLILTSWYWLPGTTLMPALVSSILVKAVDLILAFVLYKILSREARRYRAAFPEPLARAPQS
jgi:hypothetical protein